MKLTDEQIDEIINQCCDRYGELICGLTGFARAIEAACKPKWLPMESAPLDGTEIIACDKDGEVDISWMETRRGAGDKVGRWMTVGCEEFGGWFSPIKWMPKPLPEVSE